MGIETAQGTSDSGANGTIDFYWTPPTGLLACNTVNLPDTTLSPNQSQTQADDYFNTVLYTGNDGTQTIRWLYFQPDWVWIC